MVTITDWTVLESLMLHLPDINMMSRLFARGKCLNAYSLFRVHKKQAPESQKQSKVTMILARERAQCCMSRRGRVGGRVRE